MQNGFPWASIEMQIQGASKGGVNIGSDAAKSQRYITVLISLKYERDHLCYSNIFYGNIRFDIYTFKF